jgi:hypothetical protein
MDWALPITTRDLDAWDALAEASTTKLGQIDWPVIVKALVATVRQVRGPADGGPAADERREGDSPVRPGSPSQQLQELHALLDAGAERAMQSVGDGEPDGIFKSGYYMGVQVGIGLATAFAIKEMQLRDERRSAGEGELYKRHDYRAQAFDQLARALDRWLREH